MDAGDPRGLQAMEIADAHTRNVVLELLARHPSLAGPDVPLEIRTGAAMVGDLELGWQNLRVAAYFDHQRATADALEAAGWRVLSIERRLEVADFESALGLKGEG